VSTAAGPLLLMTAGPTRVPGSVLRAGAEPILHHRTAAFSRLLVSVLDGLQPIFGASRQVLPVHTTGRGAMEATIANLFSPGDELVACCNGKFGEMWANLAEDYGLIVHRACTDWERVAEPAEVEATLREYPNTKAVTIVHADSSTGVLNDVKAVMRVVRDHSALGLVDGISSIGGVPFHFDDWGVDVAVAASQKCLFASPGLAFVVVSDRAWIACEQGSLPRSYWDFRVIRNAISKSQPETPGTAPVHIFMQLAESVRLIHQEGLSEVFARHAAMAQMTRHGLVQLGLTLQCRGLTRLSPTLTAVRSADGVSPRVVRNAMMERGILVAGGLARYSEVAFRIGHMGDIRPTDVQRTLMTLAEVCLELEVAGGGTPLRLPS
jgi:serine---pyruvate transaminase